MTPRVRVFLLWVLTVLFLGRVAGQVMAGIYAPSFLPAWREWYSGLLPYPWLLLSQLTLLMFMAVVNTDNARGSGRFHVTSRRARSRLSLFAALYAGAMLLRYAATMALRPEERWTGGAVPIVFHFVLAAWVAVLACADSDHRVALAAEHE